MSHKSTATILIIDDLIDNIQVLATFLEMHHYSVTYALSCKDAMQRLEAIKPDLILLDLFMPDVDGLEICQKIKSDLRYQDIPIIFLTASDDESHIFSAFEKGAADYVTKPFAAKEVLARAATHIKLRRQTVELRSARNRLDTIVTHVKDGLLVIDKMGIIQFANPAVLHMFEKSAENLLGHELGLPLVEKKLTQIEILRLNNKMGIAEITVADILWDDEPAWIVCLRDISDREVLPDSEF